MEQSGEKCLPQGKAKMFVGEYTIRFLGKGRVALPKKIRNQLSGNQVVLSRGFEKCVFGYEEKAWESSSRQQLEIPITDPQARAVRRYLFSGATISSFDGQGRVVLPSFLLDYAQLGEELVVVGAGDHFEIWSVEAWQDQLHNFEKGEV